MGAQGASARERKCSWVSVGYLTRASVRGLVTSVCQSAPHTSVTQHLLEDARALLQRGGDAEGRVALNLLSGEEIENILGRLGALRGGDGCWLMRWVMQWMVRWVVRWMVGGGWWVMRGRWWVCRKVVVGEGHE